MSRQAEFFFDWSVTYTDVKGTEESDPQITFHPRTRLMGWNSNPDDGGMPDARRITSDMFDTVNCYECGFTGPVRIDQVVSDRMSCAYCN